VSLFAHCINRNLAWRNIDNTSRCFASSEKLITWSKYDWTDDERGCAPIHSVGEYKYFNDAGQWWNHLVFWE